MPVIFGLSFCLAVMALGSYWISSHDCIPEWIYLNLTIYHNCSNSSKDIWHSYYCSLEKELLILSYNLVSICVILVTILPALGVSLLSTGTIEDHTPSPLKRE